MPIFILNSKFQTFSYKKKKNSKFYRFQKDVKNQVSLLSHFQRVQVHAQNKRQKGKTVKYERAYLEEVEKKEEGRRSANQLSQKRIRRRRRRRDRLRKRRRRRRDKGDRRERVRLREGERSIERGNSTCQGILSKRSVSGQDFYLFIFFPLLAVSDYLKKGRTRLQPCPVRVRHVHGRQIAVSALSWLLMPCSSSTKQIAKLDRLERQELLISNISTPN